MSVEEPVVASRPGRPERYGWRLTLDRFAQRRLALAAVVFIGAVVVLALIGPAIAPSGLEDTVGKFTAPPSAAHWLGTDAIGHDELSQLLFALRSSVFAAWLAVALGVGGGLLIGLVSGYAGGKVDWAMMRLVDVMLAFPGLLLIIALIGVLGTGLINAMIALAVSFIPGFARLIRGQVLAVREELYVESAQVTGATPARIVRRHILPNIMAPFVVQVCLTMGLALIAEGALGFLGLGVQPPQTSLGAMLQAGFGSVNDTARLILIPGLVITLIAVAFNVVADGLRDALGRTDQHGGIAAALLLPGPRA
jgi:peptide/nickel transport system permease protein